jgi:VPDSG-CTERM motif
MSKPMKTPLILLPMLTLLLAPIEQASAFFCAICDGHEIPLMEITGSRKSKLSDNVGSDLGKSAAGRVRKILEEPRVFDKLGFAEGSTASGGPAAGNYRFVLDRMIRNGASDFTSPRNCGSEGYNHVPDAGSTIMLMGLALTVLGVVRHKRKL